MERVMRSAAAMAVVVGAAMSASASIKDFGALQPQVLGSGIADRGATGYGTGFEASEGYSQGTINLQLGWLTNTPRGLMEVRDGVSAGNGSPNALKLAKGPQAQGQFGIAQAPPVIGSTSFTLDTRINDDFGANYGVLGLTGANFSFRVEFDYRGTIYVIDGVNAIDTLVPWALNQWKTLAVSITGLGVEYRYDGNLIATTPIQAGGSAFDTLQIYHDNYEDISNTANAAGYFDNLNVIPSPGAVALLGLGGIMAGRRRR